MSSWQRRERRLRQEEARAESKLALQFLERIARALEAGNEQAAQVVPAQPVQSGHLAGASPEWTSSRADAWDQGYRAGYDASVSGRAYPPATLNPFRRKG